MRILFISKYARNPKYGEPTRQFLYSKKLVEQHNCEVLLVSSRSMRAEKLPKIKGVRKEDDFNGLKNWILKGPEISLGFNKKRILSWIWFELQIIRILPKLKRWKPDIVMVSSLSILTFLTGSIIKSLFKIPLVVEVRDIYPKTLLGLKGFNKKMISIRIISWIEKKGYSRADKIISSLPNLGEHVEQVLGYKKDVFYLPMGYYQNLYEENGVLTEKAKRAINKIEKIKGNFFVGYAGSIGLSNALEPTLEAFSNSELRDKGFHFFIIGDGPFKSDYEEKYGTSHNIHFLGRLEKAQLPNILSKMDVLINPWLKKEVYKHGISPNKWIDYFYSARPILAPYNGFPVFLEKYKIGWFIEPDNIKAIVNKLIEISKMDKEELDKMGVRAKKLLFETLNYENLTQKLYFQLQQIIANKTK